MKFKQILDLYRMKWALDRFLVQRAKQNITGSFSKAEISTYRLDQIFR